MIKAFSSQRVAEARLVSGLLQAEAIAVAVREAGPEEGAVSSVWILLESQVQQGMEIVARYVREGAQPGPG